MQTVTFYSYKGGSGRSLLLANAARFLALSGKRVAALDFDLEAPGLHHKLNVASADQRTADVPDRGVVEYILAANAGDEPDRLEDFVLAVPLPPGSSELWLMPAGAAPSGDYWRALTRLAKLGILSDPDGLLIADFLELKYRLEDDLGLDYLLIDARTGITELTGIATTLLADTVVCLMLDNPESLAGSRAVLRSLGRAIRIEGQDPIDVVAVLSRVPGQVLRAQRRIREYLTASGPSSAETLSIDRLFVLPEEPHDGQAEPSLLERCHETYGGMLGEGFMQIMRRLHPALGPPTAPLRRQQAADALRARLTGGGLGTRGLHTRGGSWLVAEDSALRSGAYVALTSSDEWRYADLISTDDDGSSPSFIAEYVDDVSSDEPAEWWWRRHPDLNSLLLFTSDSEGRPKHRLLSRRTETHPVTTLGELWFDVELG